MVCDALIRLHLFFHRMLPLTIDQSLTQLSEMASGGGVICLACVEPVKKENRIILVAINSTEVTVLWNEVISRDIEKRGVNLDLEQLIQKEAYICRNCYNIYDKLLEKQKVRPTHI